MLTKFFFLIGVTASVLLAGDARFNGRWDLTGQSGNRAWWFEIKGAETSHPEGSFASIYGGDLNQIQEISVQPGKLTFGFTFSQRPKRGEEPVIRHIIFKARPVGDKLEGTYEVEGQPDSLLKWVGVRAPVIADRDDGSWKEGRPVKLLDGKDLNWWRAVGGGGIRGWSISDGVLATTGKGNNIISDAKFWNFKLHVECKVASHSNSGIGLRGRYEVQVLEDYGEPPNTHGNASLYSRIAPSENASRPANQWQTYDIRLVGREVTVVLNGKTVIDKREIEGLTAIAVDSNEAQPGPLYLQGDHGPVEFRNIVLTPLVRN